MRERTGRLLGLAMSGVLVGMLTAAPASAQTRLLRFPDVCGEQVVFCYGGDLWQVSAEGGPASRLTAHPGQELFPRYSPDGAWIAFTGQYDGDEQVYVMPSSGGVPRQLTWYPARGPLPPRWGYDHHVYDWTPDGSAVLFRALRDGFDLGEPRLYTVSPDGGLPVALAMPVSGAGDFSPDGTKVVYSPLFRDFRTWKRYQGGWAQDLWIFDLQTYQTVNITDHPRSDRDPMWIGDKIYFASDRTGTLNLFSYDPTSGQTEQLTDSSVYDVRWPGDDGVGRIVFELGGELHLYDVARKTTGRIDVRVPDDGLWKRPSTISAAGLIEDYDLSPKGERALFAARGDVFTAPIEHGRTRNLTRSSDAHDKAARWSPDGKTIVFLSDRTGEEELYLVPQDGSSEPEALTSGGAAMRYAPEWAPDGERLAFSDKDGKLFVLTLEGRELVEVADEVGGQVRDSTWSPHGGHLAFSLSDPSGNRSLYLWSVEDGTTKRITGELFHEYDPSWSPDGNYLFYLSDREFAPQISSVEWNYAGNRTTGIYCLALREDVEHPFPPKSDEVTVEEVEEEEGEEEETDEAETTGEDAEDSTEAKDDDEPDHVEIDLEGLADRVVRVPVSFENYQGLTAASEGRLFFFRSGSFYYGRSSGESTRLEVYDLKEQKLETFSDDASGYALSADGKKILVRSGRSFQLFDAGSVGKNGKTVSTGGLEVQRVPVEEWQQIFAEVWRRFRDFFYVENMHGYDWDGLRRRYEPLLEHVAHRSDLNYLIGEMIAELNTSHCYIAGGDYEIPARTPVALPGARFELDSEAGRYRIARILRGQNEEDRYRSPLTEVGVEVKVGDYVLAIDGEPLTGTDNPYRLLRGKANHPVELLVNDRPDEEGARTVTFRPRTSENELIYLEWVSGNREKVAAATDGRVGYLHVPDMGADGIREFIKYFYAQIRKEGLVIDVRGNGGGNVSAMLIERLRRELLATSFSRTSDRTGTYPRSVFHGHLVCLLSETSASDGDIFPAMFRAAGLGPLIGKRSWGGIIGITNRGSLIDGGSVNVPEFGNASVDGDWVIEGFGVEPDIVVENDPRSILEGRDPQLERAIEEVLRAIEAGPKVLPGRPADPVKTPDR